MLPTEICSTILSFLPYPFYGNFREVVGINEGDIMADIHSRYIKHGYVHKDDVESLVKYGHTSVLIREARHYIKSHKNNDIYIGLYKYLKTDLNKDDAWITKYDYYGIIMKVKSQTDECVGRISRSYCLMINVDKNFIEKNKRSKKLKKMAMTLVRRSGNAVY